MHTSCMHSCMRSCMQVRPVGRVVSVGLLVVSRVVERRFVAGEPGKEETGSSREGPAEDRRGAKPPPMVRGEGDSPDPVITATMHSAMKRLRSAGYAAAAAEFHLPSASREPPATALCVPGGCVHTIFCNGRRNGARPGVYQKVEYF